MTITCVDQSNCKKCYSLLKIYRIYHAFNEAVQLSNLSCGICMYSSFKLPSINLINVRDLWQVGLLLSFDLFLTIFYQGAQLTNTSDFQWAPDSLQSIWSGLCIIMYYKSTFSGSFVRFKIHSFFSFFFVYPFSITEIVVSFQLSQLFTIISTCMHVDFGLPVLLV